MKHIKKFFWIGIVIFLGAPFSVFALNGEGGTPIEGFTLESPIGETSIAAILDNVINFLLIIAAPIAIIMTIWAGFLFMTGGGNQEKVKQARQTLFYVVIGVAVLILSKGVVSLINSLL